MATAYRNTFVNWIDNRLQQSLINGGEFVFPRWHKYESIPLRVYLLEPVPDAEGPELFARVDIANLSLRVTVNNTFDDATPLAEQQTWTKDAAQNNWYGVLDLNTAGMNSHVGSSDSVSAYLQITVSEADGLWRVVYQRSITIENSVAQPATVSPDPGQTFRTAQESDGIYDTPQMRQGLQKVIISQNGNWQRILGVDNNGAAIDVILPYP